MKITIVGTGNVGARLGHAWASKGHDVVFAARDPNDPKARSAVDAVGARASLEHVDTALRAGEIVVLAIPFAAVAGLLERGPAMTGKLLVDCTNPVGASLPSGIGSGAELVASLAAGARVVKAFNTQGAENIAAPRYGHDLATNFYCGDDAAAKAIVRGLVADVGFDPVDVGPLKNARLLESATLLWFEASRTLGTRRLAFRLLRDL